MSAGLRKCPHHRFDGGCLEDVGRRRVCTVAAALVVGLLPGCQTTGNIAPEATAQADASQALVLFSVSHDWGPPGLIGTRGMGGNVRFGVEFRSPALPDKRFLARSLVEDSLALTTSSSFEQIWGRWYVRQLPPGRYTLSQWSLTQDTGVGIRSFTPRIAPPELAFEAVAGRVVYIGNIHARLGWSKNLLGMPMLAGGLPEVRDEAARDLPLILKAYPALEGKTVKELLPLGVWLAPMDTSPYALPPM